MQTLKIAGGILIIIAGALYGFYLSARLKRRLAILCKLYSKTVLLKEGIRSGGELPRLLDACYGDCDFLSVAGFEVELSDDNLKNGDIRIIKDFFENLGLCDTEGEYSKICLFEEQLKERQHDAAEELRKKSRLFKVGGISCGVGMVILLI